MFRTAMFAAAFAMASSAVSAATIDFVVGDDSSVNLSETGSTWLCDMSSCGVSATIAPSLAGTAFSLGEGQWEAFDFIVFSGSGWGGTSFDITATLDLDTPDVDTTASGSGGAYLTFGGNITGGYLDWDNSDVPSLVELANGSKFWVNFQDGLTIFDDESVTSHAKIWVKKVGEPAPVPLPAGGLLLLGGLGALGVARLRKAG